MGDTFNRRNRKIRILDPNDAVNTITYPITGDEDETTEPKPNYVTRRFFDGLCVSMG